MKINLYVLSYSFFLFFGNMEAQTPASAILDINKVKAQINANGAMFTDFTEGQFIAPYEPGQPEVSLMRASGIWLAGTDPGGNLKGAIQAYNENGNADFQAGTLDMNGTPTDLLTGIYRVTSEDIEEHLADLNDNGNIDNPNPNVFGWPAAGNPFFAQYNNGESLPSTIQGLADFWDEDMDGIYNPTFGDFPIIGVRGCEGTAQYADEMYWFVFNDNVIHTQSGMLPLRIEVQCLVYAYDCQEFPLGNTIFTKYKLISRALENLESAYFGVFADFDIGDPEDDFFGSDPLRAMVFGYNGDANDAEYGSEPPVMAYDLLRGPLDAQLNELGIAHVMPVGENLPADAEGYYNLLLGRNEDGSTAPNNGFFYPGDPNDPSASSEVSAGNTPGNRRVVSSSGPFRLFPGAISELILGYTFYQEPGNDYLENVASIYGQDDMVQAVFDNCFDVTAALACTPTSIFEVTASDLNIYPNPASIFVTIELPAALQGPITLSNLHGQQLRTEKYPAGSEQMQLDVTDLPSGMYLITAEGADGTLFRQKIIVSDL